MNSRSFPGPVIVPYMIVWSRRNLREFSADIVLATPTSTADTPVSLRPEVRAAADRVWAKHAAGLRYLAGR